MLGSVGHLRAIFRPDDEVFQQGLVLVRQSARKAYKKTQRQLSANRDLKRLFHPTFVERLSNWDPLVKSYLRCKSETPLLAWKEQTRGMLASKGYQEQEIDDCFEALDSYRGFLEKNSFLF